MHGPSFSSFHFHFFPQINQFQFFSFSISFPKLTSFTISRLYMSCKMLKITARTWEISSWRLVEKFHISAFPMYYSLCNWIGEHEITKLKKYICFESRKRGHKNMHKKTWIKWNGTKWTIWYIQQCACVNAIYFASVVTTTHCHEKQTRAQQGVRASKWVVARARAQLLNMLYNSPHLSVPHGENI